LNISELRLLIQVSRIEDLAEKSSGRADQKTREQLKTAAKGFRNLIAHPERYDVDDNRDVQRWNSDLRRWATVLESKFKRAEKSKTGHDPDASEGERDLAVELRNLDVGKLSASISKNFLSDDTELLKESQKQALRDAGAHQSPS
jgi:hypothetical protein